MRLGLFMMPVHPPGRVLADTLAEDEEKALYADRLGFDELWLGEHFSAATEPIPSPLMFMAGLVPRARNLSFGTAVICLPNHHPVKVAAEVAQFDHMSRVASCSVSASAGSIRISNCSTTATARCASAR